MLRLIHTADWQLGKPYGRFDGDVRAALSEARFDAIDAIGMAAAEHDVANVLVAGDVFDTEGPEDRVIVQAVSRMQRYACTWWLLPGNHDFARNSGLWDRVRAKGAANVRILAEPVPCELEPGQWLLPAPLTHRHNLDDPTALFDTMETPSASLRIGLAHGSIRDFSSRGEAQNQIAPDRAQRSGLDYLALGDWHGSLRVDARTWYSGTPETDRFQRDEPGYALLVTLKAGAEPSVSPIRTGRFQWLMRSWTVADAEGFAAECDRLLAQVESSATLLQLSLSGIVSLSDRIAILARLDNDLRHRLRHLAVTVDDLVGRPSEQDLADLRVEGMIGTAAAKLMSMIEAGGSDGAIARRALERLTGRQTAARDEHEAAQRAASEAATRLTALEQGFSDLEAARARLKVLDRDLADTTDAEQRRALVGQLDVARSAAQLLDTRRAEQLRLVDRVRAFEDLASRLATARKAVSDTATALSKSRDIPDPGRPASLLG